MSENKEREILIEEDSLQSSEQKAHEQAAAHAEHMNTGIGAKPSVVQSNSTASSRPAIDVKRIVQLLQNPLSSLKLDGYTDILYGVLGILASLVGYLLLVAAVGKKISSLTYFGLFGLGGSLFGRMLLLALISNAALLGSIWLIGMWKGKKKLGFMPLITHFGALQYGAGALFLVAALVSWMSFGLMLMLLVAGLLIVFVLSIVAALEVYGVAKESFSHYIMLTTSAYVIITMLLTNVLF